jgi:hypothetical protein
MGFKAQDGTRYVAKPGTHVNVEERHMGALKSQDYAQAGLVDAGAEKQFIRDTKKQGRWCKSCNRLWNSWNDMCPRCDQVTIPENEMDRTTLKGQYHP